jgi:hypothetical protein
MNGNQSAHGTSGSFDLFANPFHILGVEPAASIQQLQSAFDRGASKQPVSADALAIARDIALDPQRRLPHELGYPLDSTPAEIDEIYITLAGKVSQEDRFAFASRLRPLARANFLGHLAAKRTANGALLSAVLNAHASIEVLEIFEILKAVRASAGYVAPSLVSVNEGLVEHAQVHARAAIARYGLIKHAADPVMACTQETLLHGGRHHIEALAHFLAVYRQSVLSQQTAMLQGIEGACEALLRHPADAQSLDILTDALLAWITTCRPLLVWDSHQGSSDPEIRLAIGSFRAAIVSLSGHERYDVALHLAEFGRDVFDFLPEAANQFDADAALIAELLVEAKTHPPHIRVDNDVAGPRNESRVRSKRMRFLRVFVLVSIAAVCVTGIFLGFRTPWPSPSPDGDAGSIAEVREAETMPAVGAGQHLELSGVRYCVFQEARLHAMKPDVRGTEDIRAYNKLAQDYNSRCSDYFYRDSDLDMVKAEMAHNSQRLTADAKRMMSAWPGRGPPTVP